MITGIIIGIVYLLIDIIIPLLLSVVGLAIAFAVFVMMIRFIDSLF